MRLSIIIVSYNVKYFTEQCLQSVRKAAHGISCEIFVVDNNSVDGSVQMVKEKFPEAVLIENKDNAGFSKANNQAIKQAKGDYILLLNPDTIVEEDTFRKILVFMDEHAEAGGLGVKMYDGKGNFLPESKRGLPTPEVAFYKIFGLSSLFPKSKIFGRYHLGYLDNDKVNEVDVLSGAFMLLRKSVLDKTGLLDEAFFMYGEDIDLSYRITKTGYKNYYFPEARIIHYKGESTKKSSINYVVVFYKAMQIFARKHFAGRAVNNYLLLINAAIFIRAMVAIANRFVKKMYLPLTDFSTQLIAMFIMKSFYHRLTGIIYTDAFVSVAFTAYSFLWVVALWISGAYQRPLRFSYTVRGILLGTAAILVLYALLPEEYRFSRALILLGMCSLTVICIGSRWVLQAMQIEKFYFAQKQKKRIAIVGDEEEIARVKKILSTSFVQSDYIAHINPRQDVPSSNSGYITSLAQLSEAIRIFNINEVIFCAKNLPAQAIITQMALPSSADIEYKIAPPESMFIIGSQAINAPGNLYVLESNHIDKPGNHRRKRTFDVITAFLFLFTYPLLVWFVDYPMGFLGNIFFVLFGKKSWVGYLIETPQAPCQKPQVQWEKAIAQDTSADTLPRLREGVLTPGDGLDTSTELPDPAELNTAYSKNYSLLYDAGIIRNGFRSLGRIKITHNL